MIPPVRPREAHRKSGASGFKHRPKAEWIPSPPPSQPPSQPSPPRSPQLLQSVYDTYAENIHAISVRASSNSALSSSYGAVDRAPVTRRSTSASSSSHDADYDWRLSPMQTGFHFISFMAGSGLVFLPLALVDLDWYGVGVLVVAAGVCLYTAKLLIEAMDILRWSSGQRVTYCDLARACLGTHGYYVTACLLYASFLVSATGYIALVTSCITGMTGANYELVLLVVGSCVWFHVLVKSLKALAIFSAINVGVCVWIETVIFGDAMYPLRQITLDESVFIFGTPDLSSTSLLVKLAYAFSLLASGFFCHSVIPTFYNAMADHHQCRAVVARSQIAVLACLYVPVCVVTYAVYGPTLEAPVFFNMRNPVVRNLAIVLYCIHLLLSYTTTLAPLQRALERLFSIASDEQRRLRTPTPAMLGLLNHSDAFYKTDDDVVHADRSEWWLQLLVRSATVIATVALASIFRPTTLGIFGVTIIPATTLSLILPCVFFWTLCTEEAGCLDKLAIVAIVVMAIASMGVSVYTTIALG